MYRQHAIQHPLHLQHEPPFHTGRVPPAAQAPGPAGPAPAPGPALRAALSVRAMARVLDVVDYGLLLVADDGQVLYVNAAGQADLDDGHALQIDSGWIATVQPDDAPLLAAARQDAARRAMQALLTLHGRSGDPVAVAVVPLAEPGELPMTLLVLGRRQACEELSHAAFARHHGLTPTEARVLLGLCDGLRPADIARSQGVQLSTVRTQIAGLRTKTGCRNIGQLVSLIWRLPPLPRLLARPRR